MNRASPFLPRVARTVSRAAWKVKAPDRCRTASTAASSAARSTVRSSGPGVDGRPRAGDTGVTTASSSRAPAGTNAAGRPGPAAAPAPRAAADPLRTLQPGEFTFTAIGVYLRAGLATVVSKRSKGPRGTMSLPLTEAQTRKATRWLAANFGAAMRAAVAGTPFGVDLICGIACKETASMWIAWIDRGLSPDEIVSRAIGDASGDFPNTTRTAFPTDTAAFRAAFGDAFTDLLIAEANAMRALRGFGPKPWVYKGYGLFQYDLQHVQADPAFFQETQWHAFDACLSRVVGELQRKFQHTGELWAAVKAYNGSGPRADAYRDDVRILTGWAKAELDTLAPPVITTRSAMAKRSAAPKGRKAAAGTKKPRRPAPRAFRGASLHIGLNAVDPGALRRLERAISWRASSTPTTWRRSPRRRASRRRCC